MHLRFIEIDELLDRANDARLAASSAKQRAFAQRLQDVWCFHELQLEGVAVRPDDIQRAHKGVEGADFCDRVLLEQIGRTLGLLSEVRRAAVEGDTITFATLREWQAQLEVEAKGQPLRDSEGPTEHYKHDVADPAECHARVEQALALLSEGATNHHPLELANEVLFAMMKAWPFNLWSGMIARLVASVAMIRGGYPPLLIGAHQRQSFYQAMHYDLARMEEVVLSAVREELEAQLRIFDGQG